ncbi:EP300-interacting inhibitor of differentiation 2-like [Manis pentadactyla]|uniref:EP300-interacting inhibitor of differentiation 2-like n=1 Tax=Manis pentadactyla TaxID=143292 RepID=UPI00255CEA0E|nr:EP300-interacting inhibitor of differentiation 2-like [Manis pentadactyla]
MSELPADCSVPHPDAEDGDRDAPQAEVGGGPREPFRARPEEPGEGPMAAAREVLVAAARAAGVPEVARLLAELAEEERREGRPGNGPGLAASPHRLRRLFSLFELNYRHFPRLYLPLSLILARMQVLERRRRSVEARRAREAAFDAEHLWNPQRLAFGSLTHTIALTASEVIDPLVEELGCDKFINRE